MENIRRASADAALDAQLGPDGAAATLGGAAEAYGSAGYNARAIANVVQSFFRGRRHNV